MTPGRMLHAERADRRWSPPRRILTAAAVFGALVLAVGLMPLLSAPTAQAVEDQSIDIEITSFEPAVPTRDGQLTITGTLTNVSDTPIANVRPYLWRNQGPITNRIALDPILAGQLPSESRVFVDGAFQNLTDGRGPMQPGEELSFEVSAEIEALDLPRASGVYPVGVDVLGQVNNGPNSVPGQTRLLLPLPAADTEPPAQTKITSIVMLSSEPTMYAPGLFANDDLATELISGGRFSELLTAARTEGMTWAIDPALYDEITTLATAYQVRRSDGSFVPGTGTAAAEAWLSEFDQLDQTAGFRLPWALVDAEAALINERTDLIERAEQLSAASPLSGLPLLEWFGDGATDTALLDGTLELNPAVVLSADAITAHRLLRPPIVGSAPLVRYDPLAYSGGPEGTSAAHERQRLLAEAYIDALSQPNGGGTVRVIDDADAAAAELAADAPWVERLTLTGLLATDPNEWGGTFADAPLATAPLSAETIEWVTEVEQRAEPYVLAQTDPEAARQDLETAAVRAASTTWRTDDAGQQAFLDPIERDVDHFLSGADLQLQATRRVTMDDQQGLFPITISSQLPHPVTVGVAFDSENDARLTIPDLEPVVIPPGESVALDARPEAVTNGTVPVLAQLITPDGTRIGAPVEIEVEATRLGFVGWIIVAISGIVLIVSTLLRIRQVRRHGRPVRTTTDADPNPVDDMPPISATSGRR